MADLAVLLDSILSDNNETRSQAEVGKVHAIWQSRLVAIYVTCANNFMQFGTSVRVVWYSMTECVGVCYHSAIRLMFSITLFY